MHVLPGRDGSQPSVRRALTFLCILIAVAAPALCQNYSAVKDSVDGVEVIRLADRAQKAEVLIIPSVGNIAYEFKVNGRNAFWTPDGWSPARTKERPAMAGNPFLWPWANRLDSESYYANGQKYLLNPDLKNYRMDGNRQPIHGLVMYSKDWQVVSVKAGRNGAETTSRLEYWKYPELMAQFPFAHTVEMTHRLKDGTLEVETVVNNLSTKPIPVVLGYHPYFQVHDAPRNEWRVNLPARDHVTLSPTLVPTGERKPSPYAQPVALSGLSLDDVFTNLIRGGDGRSEFWVQGAKQKVSVVYGPKYTVAVVYAPPRGRYICFEPMSGVTNAANLAQKGLYSELQSVPPGASWKESFWVKTEGF